MDKTQIVVICGPTASGKSNLAVQLASRLNGEIISADSMQVYAGMEIATAQPGLEEQCGVPHHLMGFASPSAPFSVADYVALARQKTDDVQKRGRLPFLVGGTGLYIQAVVDHFQFDDTAGDSAYRDTLRQLAEEKGVRYLHELLRRVDSTAAAQIHPNNVSRVIRALEVHHISGKTITQAKLDSRREPSPYTPLFIGLAFHDRALLYERIDQRVDSMIENGLVEEARRFFACHDKPTAIQAIGYKELKPYLDGSAALADCIQAIKQNTRKYAKRQITWFKKEPRMHWVYPDAEADETLMKKCENLIKNSGNYEKTVL